MAPDHARTFPTRCLEEIAPGAMLRLVGSSYLNWLLTEEPVARDDPKVAAAVKEKVGLVKLLFETTAVVSVFGVVAVIADRDAAAAFAETAPLLGIELS